MNTKEACIICDFDSTLVDPEVLIAHADMLREEVFTESMIPLVDWEKLDRTQYVYSEVVGVLSQLKKQGNQLILFSEGDIVAQRYKFDFSGIQEFFDLIWISEDKINKLKSWLEDISKDKQIYYLDDRQEKLMQAKKIARENGYQITTILVQRGIHWQNTVGEFVPDMTIEDLSELKI